MAKFYLIYYSPPPKPSSPEEGKAMQAEWMQWMKDLGTAALDKGNPMGNSKFVASGGVTDTGGEGISCYNMVEAEDVDAAVEMAKSCPFVKMGGTIQVAQAFEMGG